MCSRRCRKAGVGASRSTISMKSMPLNALAAVTERRSVSQQK